MNPPKECQCCGFEGAELKPYNIGFPDDRPLYYCDLCAGTDTSNLSRSRSVAGPAAQSLPLMKTACYIGNALLVELRALNANLVAVEESIRASRGG